LTKFIAAVLSINKVVTDGKSCAPDCQTLFWFKPVM